MRIYQYVVEGEPLRLKEYQTKNIFTKDVIDVLKKKHNKNIVIKNILICE